MASSLTATEYASTAPSCPKCGKELVWLDWFNGYEPYCGRDACLLRDITSWSNNPEGGFLTYVQGNKYPMRALPFADSLNAVALAKRSIIAGLFSVSKMPLLIAAAALTPKRTLVYQFCRWLDQIYYADYGGHLKVPLNNYCPSAKEFMRVFDIINPYREVGWYTLLTVIYDSDLAYRFRIQDVLQEFNKAYFKKHPRLELWRLFKLSLKRELNPGQKRKTRLVMYLVMGGLMFKQVRKLLYPFLLELDVEKVRMDINDNYWVTERYDYDYGGKTFAERQAWRAKEHEGWDGDIKPVVGGEHILNEKPRLIINPPNLAFYMLPEKEAEHMAEQVRVAVIDNWRTEHKKLVNTNSSYII